VAFSIELLSDLPDHWEDGKCAYDGRIVLGEFVEQFSADGTFWNARDYRRHWRGAISGILGRNRKSALITGLADPVTSSFLWWWPLYREGDVVHVQHGLLLFEQLGKPFDPNDPESSVPDRVIRDDEGFRLSEWHVGTSDLKAFLQT
jgi:hypothetical protein